VLEIGNSAASARRVPLPVWAATAGTPLLKWRTRPPRKLPRHTLALFRCGHWRKPPWFRRWTTKGAVGSTAGRIRCRRRSPSSSACSALARNLRPSRSASSAIACPGWLDSLRQSWRRAPVAASDDLQSFIRVIGVAEHALAAAVGRDVPGVALHNGADFARWSQSMRHKGARPDREHQVPGAAEKGFVNQKLIVAVLVEAIPGRCRPPGRGASAGPRSPGRTQSIPVPAGGTAGELRCAETGWYASRFHRSGRQPGRTVRRIACGGEPLAIAADGAFA